MLDQISYLLITVTYLAGIFVLIACLGKAVDMALNFHERGKERVRRYEERNLNK